MTRTVFSKFSVLINLICLFTSLKCVYCQISSDPVVITQFGRIVGTTQEIAGYSIDQFLGIKYAEIPTRFKASQVLKKPWNGTLEARDYGPSCMQKGDISMSEDCLYMNIWRPKTDKSSDRLRPILIYIHGSGYQRNSGATNPGDFLAGQGDMIVAAFNYRLSCFGYMYGDDTEIPGNQAYTDIISALLWIQENIRHFGGDPTQITLSGHSAGSMMASLFPVLPSLPVGLYQKMLLSSGVTGNAMYIEDKSIGLEKTKLLASKVGCLEAIKPGPLSPKVIQCLQSVDVSLLTTHGQDKDIAALGGAEIASFLPVYGTSLIPKPFIELVKSYSKSNYSTPITIGIQRDEQALFFPNLKPTSLDQAYNQTLARLSFVKKDLTEREMNQFFNYYFDKVNPSNPIEIRSQVFEFLNDFSWRCTSLLFAEAYSAQHPVFFYEFRYHLGKHSDVTRPDGPWHSDSLELVFGQPFKNPSNYSNQDRKISSRLIKHVSDYVKSNPDSDEWPQIKFDKNEPFKNPSVRIIDILERNVDYQKQLICISWGKLLGYDITSL